MRKTGNTCYIGFLLFLLAWNFHSRALAQTPFSVESTVSESIIFTGERLQLNITVSGDFNQVTRPSLPSFSGLNLLNDTPSTSRNVSYSNGVTRSSYTYSYFLIAPESGTFTIPPITVSVDDENFRTEPIDITVKDRNKASEEGTADNQPDIFLRMNVSDPTPVRGQQLLANIVLYFKEGLEVSSYQPIPGWKAEGFWKEELENAERPQVQSSIINGVRFRTARLLQFALFPTKSGKLTISPYEIRVSVRSASQRGDPFSSFFGGFGTNQRQLELKTDAITVDVNGLPQAPDSAKNIGGVGSFQINRDIKTSDATVGESIEIETTVSGAGNITLINKPEYNFPDGLEVYEPQENAVINRKNQQISGTKTYTDVVIARTPGSYTIPEIMLAYFNPTRNEYVTEMLPAKSFTVASNPNAVASEQPQSFSVQPITGLANWIAPAHKSAWNSWWLWAGLLLPVVAFAIAYWQKSYRDKMNTDRAFARSQKAENRAQDHLQQALDHAENGRIKEAYNALQKALGGFISDRLGLPEAGLSIEQHVAALQERDVNEELVKNVRMLLNKSVTINYAPDASEDHLKSHVGLAESIIRKLKKEL